MISKPLNQCKTFSELGQFLQNVDPRLGRLGGRYFVSQETEESRSMNEIVYQLQQIVKKNHTDKVGLQTCYDRVQQLEQSIDISKAGLFIQILTKVRQKVGNFFFSITHNHFDRKEVLKELALTKCTSYTDFVKALNEQDENAVRVILKDRTDKEVVQYAKDFLASIYRKAERDDKRIALLLTQLQKRFPNVAFTDYFIQRFEGIILCPDGIRIVLDYLRAKGAIKPDANIIVCDSLEDLTKKASQLDWNKEFRAGFLVRARNKDRPTELHIIPGYIENRPGKSMEVLITDTAGTAVSIYNKVKTTYTNMFVKYLDMGLPKGLQYKVYANGFLRQYNWTACPIFSIRDLVQIFRNPQVMEKIRTKYANSKEQITFMEDLPLVLMKPHHGLTVLDKIAGSKEGREEVVGYTKDKKPQTLYENLERHKIAVFKGETSKLLNNYTNEREVKYLGVILNNILSG